MRATEVLRRMLDERGVEHSDFTSAYRLSTRWQDSSRRVIEHQLRKDADIGDMGIVRNLTPEQAIAATLGRGECEIETTENWLPAERYHRCKHCGAFFAVMNASGDIQPCVCPNCGRKVKR